MYVPDRLINYLKSILRASYPEILINKVDDDIIDSFILPAENYAKAQSQCFEMGAEDAQVFAKEYGDQYSSEDLVSLERYQVINKLSIDNIVSKPFPALTLALAKSSNSNKNKVIQVSGERYARKSQN